MAERKAVRALRVALTPGIEKLPSVKKELIAKGHEVVVLPELAEFDLVLGINAHRFNKNLEKLLPVAIKSARIRKYSSKGGKVVEDYDTEGDE